eukprot:c18515_g1_i2 orf=56-436(-)
MQASCSTYDSRTTQHQQKTHFQLPTFLAAADSARRRSSLSSIALSHASDLGCFGFPYIALCIKYCEFPIIQSIPAMMPIGSNDSHHILFNYSFSIYMCRERERESADAAAAVSSTQPAATNNGERV